MINKAKSTTGKTHRAQVPNGESLEFCPHPKGKIITSLKKILLVGREIKFQVFGSINLSTS